MVIIIFHETKRNGLYTVGRYIIVKRLYSYRWDTHGRLL